MFKNLAHMGGGGSPFRRIKNAVVGVFVGILMIPGSVILMGWNEYRSVQTIKSLNETMEQLSPDVDVSQLDPALDGVLIHFSSLAETKETLSDPDFKFSEVAIKLRRKVETFQWIEYEDDDDDGPTTYYHRKEWAEQFHDSKQFREPGGHQNVAPRIKSNRWSARQVSTGAYTLSDSLLSEIENFATVRPVAAQLEKLEGDLKSKCVLDGDYVYYPLGKSKTGEPRIGDQRIRLEIIRPQEYSFISTVVGGTFRPYKAKNGREVELVEPGIWTAEEMIEHALAENAMWTWILRGVGFLVCFIGVGMVFGPISMIMDYVPFFGAVAKGGIFIVSLLFALVVSAMTISVSWIMVRPMIGIPLFVLGIGGIGLIIYYGTRNRKRTQEQHPRFGPAEVNVDDDRRDNDSIEQVDQFH